MTSATDRELYYDPYDFEIDTDPYPVWKRLRDEAPLYYNEKHDFYALSRFDDVKSCSTDWKHLHLGQGIGPRAHQERDGDPAGDHPVRGPPGARPAPEPSRAGCSRRGGWPRSSRRRGRSAPGRSTRSSTRGDSTSFTTWRPRCRCGSSACCSAFPRRTRRRSATRSTGACGSTRGRRPSHREGLGVMDGRQVRRVHRLAGGPPLRRPHDRPAQRRVRGRERDRPEAHPG